MVIWGNGCMDVYGACPIGGKVREQDRRVWTGAGSVWLVPAPVAPYPTLPSLSCYISGRALLSNLSSVDFLMRYACLLPRCGSVIASNAPLLIHRRTVVSSTRRRRATSRTVNSSSLVSSAIFPSPAPFRRRSETTVFLRDIGPPCQTNRSKSYASPTNTFRTCVILTVV